VSITGTLIVQIIVFLILVWFTMKFVWPPITAALDERAQKIADGLAAADKAKADLSAANKRVEEELSKSRNEIAGRLADAERRISEMKSKALADVGQIAAETAEAIVGQLTGKTVAKDEAAQAVKLVAGE